MAVAIFFALLLSLLIFIIWDRRRLTALTSREEMKNGGPPSKISKWPVYAGFSLISAALGMAEWFNPGHPPFTGRWASVRAVLHESVGSKGFAYSLAALAVGLAIAAAIQWRSDIPSRRSARAVAR